MNIKWEKAGTRDGELARVGRVVVGSAFYSAFGSKDNPNKYTCSCQLPGIKQVTEQWETLDEAKARLERMVRAWFMWTAQEPVKEEGS